MSHNVVQETERRHIGLIMEGRNMDLRYLEEVVHSSLKIEREEGELSPTPETEDRQNTLFAHASNVVSGTDTVPRGCYPSKCICILKRLKHYLQELLQAQSHEEEKCSEL